MRAPPQSTFRRPLDEILGRVSCVRVLRELVLHGRPLSATDLASRVSLSKTSVGNALSVLSDMGIVEPVGTGRYVDYRIRDSHFLFESLRLLFRHEDGRVARVFDALRDIAEGADPEPRAVWLYGSVARGEDGPDSDLDVLVVASEPYQRAALEERFGDALLDVADEWDFTPSVVVVTAEEVRRGLRDEEGFFVRLDDDAVPLYGRLPGQLERRG